MASTLDLIIKAILDTKSVEDGAKKIETTAGRIKKAAKGIGLGLGAAFSVKAVSGFVEAAQESEVEAKKVDKAFKNAGDTTGKWAKHANDLADNLQSVTGVDDEAIRGAETLLATFDGLAKTAGQTGGAFDRATGLAVDLSKAGFGSLDTSAKALGKALQDPEKGLGALKKAGISFTAAEKQQITAMVKAGDTAGAYNLILDKVDKKVGGLAASTVTSSDKMRVAWDETKESLGKALLPVLEAVAPVLQTIAQFVQQNVTWIVPLVAALWAWTAVQSVLNTLVAAFGIELAAPVGLVAALVVAVLAAWVAVGLLYAKWDEVWSFIADLPAYAQVALAILVVTNPVLLLIAVVTTLGVYWDTIWSKVTDIVGAAANLISTDVGFIVDKVTWLVDQIASVLAPVYDFVDTYLVQPFEDAWDVIQRVVNWIADKVAWVTDKLGALKSGVEKLGDIAFAPIGGNPFSALGIRGLQAGGIVTSPTLAMVGEAGPEAVIPLTGAGSSGVGITVNITTTGLGADAPAIGSAVVAALRNHTTRNGPLDASIVGR